MNIKPLIFFRITLIIAIPFSHAQNMSLYNGQFFGQDTPSTTPILFAPGFVSMQGRKDSHCIFSPNGDECFMTIENVIVYTQMLTNGKWSKPIAPASLNVGKPNNNAVFGPDGLTVFFVSNRFRPSHFDLDILVLQRRFKDDWGKPKQLPRPVYSGVCEVSPSVTKDGTLYYASYFDPARPMRDVSNPDMYDIYRAELQNGQYRNVENLGPCINNVNYQIGCAVNSEESILVYGDGTTWPEQGQRDLWVSFRINDQWSDAVKLGPEFNTDQSEGGAAFSWDGKYFFFSSKKSGDSDIYWVDAAVFDRYRPYN